MTAAVVAAGVAPRWFASRAELDGAGADRLANATLDGLWVWGSLAPLSVRTVAIVGTRSPSEVARTRSHRIAYELSSAGVRVISGLGLGVDAAAHQGAIDAGANSIAIAGCGLAAIPARRPTDLAQRIVAAGGAVVSPFEPAAAEEQWRLVASNGVIAVLADAVLFVEANYRSVAIGVAGFAADRGTPVMAFPGDPDNFKMGGCNSLIRDGATLVRTTTDILELLPLPREERLFRL